MHMHTHRQLFITYIYDSFTYYYYSESSELFGCKYNFELDQFQCFANVPSENLDRCWWLKNVENEMTDFECFPILSSFLSYWSDGRKGNNNSHYLASYDCSHKTTKTMHTKSDDSFWHYDMTHYGYGCDRFSEFINSRWQYNKSQFSKSIQITIEIEVEIFHCIQIPNGLFESYRMNHSLTHFKAMAPHTNCHCFYHTTTTTTTITTTECGFRV